MDQSKDQGPDSSPVEIAFPNRDHWELPKPDRPTVPDEPVPPPEPGEWTEAIDRWVRDREQKRPENPDERERRPRAYLDISATFAPQISAFQVGERGTVTVTVWNDGNVPSWACYVEVYEGFGGFNVPLSDHRLRGRDIGTLHPGQRRNVTLTWLREAPTGRIVAIVFDPIRDPTGFTLVPQTDRHIASASYVNLA
jgi:hypothetical protein